MNLFGVSGLVHVCMELEHICNETWYGCKLLFKGTNYSVKMNVLRIIYTRLPLLVQTTKQISSQVLTRNSQQRGQDIHFTSTLRPIILLILMQTCVCREGRHSISNIYHPFICCTFTRSLFDVWCLSAHTIIMASALH